MSSNSVPRKFIVNTQDDWPLSVTRLDPDDGSSRGAILCMHAMMVDGRTFLKTDNGFAEYFRNAGWTVFVADYRGHGSSGPTPREGGCWSYDDLVLKDLPPLIESVHRQHPDGPLIFIGHSLGGHTGLAAAGLKKMTPQPDAFVLLSSNLWQPEFEPNRWLRIKKRASLRAMRFLVSRFGYFPARRLRMGPCDESKEYLEQLVDPWEHSRWTSRDSRLDYAAGLREMTAPVLSILGRADRIMASWDGARNWFESLELPNGECWLVGNEDESNPWSPNHMTLVTDSRSQPIWERIDEWFETVLATT